MVNNTEGPLRKLRRQIFFYVASQNSKTVKDLSVLNDSIYSMLTRPSKILKKISTQQNLYNLFFNLLYDLL